MPELPDIMLYLDALKRFVAGREIRSVMVKSPFLVRTFQPDLHDIVGRQVTGFRRFGKRIVWELDSGLWLVFHLMIAGRFQWRKPGTMPRGRNELLTIGFADGTLLMTEASQKKRASLHVVDDVHELARFDRAAVEVLECSLQEFASQLTSQNRSVKRALTDPRQFSGIGNAYSDEILLEAGLSPFKRTQQLDPAEVESLFRATKRILSFWIDRLTDEVGDAWPTRVTAFREGMMAHGRYDKPCPKCQTKIQRVRFSENELNYCPRCQTGGRVLADRSLSRLLREEWPRTIEELEENQE